MTAALTFLILIAPFVVAAAISWAARRSGSLRFGIDQFPVSAPMVGRLYDDADIRRIGHDLDAVRARLGVAAEHR